MIEHYEKLDRKALVKELAERGIKQVGDDNAAELRKRLVADDKTKADAKADAQSKAGSRGASLTGDEAAQETGEQEQPEPPVKDEALAGQPPVVADTLTDELKKGTTPPPVEEPEPEAPLTKKEQKAHDKELGEFMDARPELEQRLRGLPENTAEAVAGHLFAGKLVAHVRRGNDLHNVVYDTDVPSNRKIAQDTYGTDVLHFWNDLAKVEAAEA